MSEIILTEEPLYLECHYCHNEADYESMLQEIIVCKHCVKEYIKQEVLTDIRR